MNVALKASPADAAFYDLLGVLHAQQGKYRDAESDLRKALGLDPLLTGTYLNLGHLYQQNSTDWEAPRNALAAYEGLLKLDPGNIEANYQGAVLLQRRKAFQSSLDHLAPAGSEPLKSAGDQHSLWRSGRLGRTVKHTKRSRRSAERTRRYGD